MSEYLYLISKASRERDPEYKPSVFNRVPGKRENQLDVYYRRGTATRRFGRGVGYELGGGTAGTIGGGGVGAGIGALAGKATGRGGKLGALVGADLGGLVGGVSGSIAGRHKAENKNIRTGDLKFVRRGDKKRVTRTNLWSGPSFER